MTQRRTLFVSTTPLEAYRQWKAYWRLTPEVDPGSETRLLADVPNRGVRWSGRFGPARVYGQADFIPVQGGCVVYLAITAASGLSRLLLSSPFERLVWRAAERFCPKVEGAHVDKAA